ncbi:hypothetical protein [Candidatus Entotheonella palauensis]|uniref:hypothetical protein n=1 Tax=Candidatus Entotheonella palauensis TaxID=93172 RepID=UPI000B7FADDB|nr:hypothetical protein [Candidatus Entotheonella palauensis]
MTWEVELANWKAFRRTQDEADKIRATLSAHPHSSSAPEALEGSAGNFLPNATIPMGWFQCLQTDSNHRGIRARLIPPHGKVYGPPASGDPNVIPVLRPNSPWTRHNDDSIQGSGPSDYFPPRTVPWQIYAGEEFGGIGISRGFLDDMSDGLITVRVSGPGIAFSASTRIVVAPPDYAPDRLQFRSLGDDLEFFEFGAQSEAIVPDRYVTDLVERALDNAEALQLEYAKANSGWRRFGGQDITFDPDEAREVHLEVLADALELLDGNERGIFRNRSRFLRAIREPGELEGGRKMPLYMVGQNRAPLWLTPKQYNRLSQWSTQSVGEEPPPDDGGPGDGVVIDPAQARQDMLALIRKKRDEDDAARRHRVRLPDGRHLGELFGNEEELLNYVQTALPIRNAILDLQGEPLVTPGDLSKSVFYQLIVHPDGPMLGEFDDDEIAVVARGIQSLS